MLPGVSISMIDLCYGGKFMPQEKASEQLLPHNLIIEQRKTLNASGVKDVDSFDEQTVVAVTQLGELTVRGNNLRISNFNAQTGDLSVEGSISSVSYSDDKPVNGGFFSRVFR